MRATLSMMTRWKGPIIGGLVVAVLTVLSAPLWNEAAIEGNPDSGGNLLVNAVIGIALGALVMIVLWIVGKRR